MLKGDLASAPLAPLLLQLADDETTGCLHIADPEGEEALIYLKDGLVYAVSVPGRRPQLGAKLVSSGALEPEALADALEAQRTELQGWRLGELLVHLGYVDQPVVEAFVKEQVHDALWDLFRWNAGEWRLRKNEKTREDVAPPMTVADLLANLRSRGYGWGTISSVVHGPTAVPVLSTRGEGAPETTLDADAWSMLCKIDGQRSVAALAADCGFTLFEAGTVLVTLVQAGFVDITEDVAVADVVVDADDADVDGGADGASDEADEISPYGAGDDGDLGDEFAVLVRRVGETTSRSDDDDSDLGDDADGADRQLVYAAAAVARVEYDTPSPINLHPGSEESFAASLAQVSAALSEVLGPETPTFDPFDVPGELRTRRARKPAPPKPQATPESERRARTRAAAAAELAAAHALAEALRAAHGEDEQAVILGWPPEPVTDGEDGDAEVVDLAAVRREAERVEAERVEAEEEAARLEAERVAAEEEAARLEAERVEAEEEAAQLEAERVEAERLAEEEAARLAAEEEAARIEADRLAEEEAARVEAERLAAEEAARVEAERHEAEEAARLAAGEEAARIEADRVAAEEEAARAAAEEFARLAAEQLAAEISEAEDAAWSEYWQREGAAAAAAEAIQISQQEAAALLMELSAEPTVSTEHSPERQAEPAAEFSVENDEDNDDAADDDDDEPAAEAPPDPVDVDLDSPTPVFTDTAALLRELSSLGFDDEPKPPPAHRPQHPPRPTSPPKKKRGLFGF